MAEVFARAAKNKELDRLIEAGARHYLVDDLKIVLAHRLLRVSPDVSFDLKSIFFVKDVTFCGIRL